MALENTTISIGGGTEEKLTTGQGLMQVDRSHKFVQQSKNLPYVCYRITTNQAGKSTPTLRGIYLKGADACKKTSEMSIIVIQWTISSSYCYALRRVMMVKRSCLTISRIFRIL